MTLTTIFANKRRKKEEEEEKRLKEGEGKEEGGTFILMSGFLFFNSLIFILPFIDF